MTCSKGNSSSETSSRCACNSSFKTQHARGRILDLKKYLWFQLIKYSLFLSTSLKRSSLGNSNLDTACSIIDIYTVI